MCKNRQKSTKESTRKSLRTTGVEHYRESDASITVHARGGWGGRRKRGHTSRSRKKIKLIDGVQVTTF